MECYEAEEFLFIIMVNGSYVTNFDSTVSSGSDKSLTLGNIRDGGGVPFLGTIAAIYAGITGGVLGPIKEEMKTLCRDYKVMEFS